MRILFLTQTTQIGPASRYRVYQYLDYLKKNDIECTVSSALPEIFYSFFYRNTNIAKKILLLPVILIRRLRDLFRVRSYDLVFIQREILPQLFPLFEIIISKLNKKIVFDFDDAIFLIPPQRNSRMYIFRDKRAIERIINLSALVIAGNDYLKQYALRFNQQVELIPTAIDTGKWTKAVKRKSNGKPIIIGWIGTRHNLFYLQMLKPILEKLSLEYSICLHVISDAVFAIKGIQIINIPWELAGELTQVQEFDIGIAPLSDDDWAKGKCGLKALQYMACSIPAVCSDVGVYKQIIQQGSNGFLAADESQWYEKLSLLINDPELRERLGNAARKTVKDNYSLEINSIKLKEIIASLR